MALGRLILALFAAVALPAAAATHYTVVFHQQSIPADADKIVSAAGGTIVERLPEIGGLGVVSDNPGFSAALNASSAVRAADVSIQVSIDPTLSRADEGVTGAGSTNNGNVSPAGADPQPMPDPLGNQQWDKMRMNATLTGSYATQQGRKDVRVAIADTGIDQTHVDI